MHDPDAPRHGGFTHWVLYNIPGNVAHLEPNVPRKEQVAGTGTQGKNDSGQIGYMVPCPPSGTHRYFLRLYALERYLELKPGATQKQVEQAMSGHVLAQA
jgi:Raf kinase inhibitor-like YbhB/YbcL family protein